ncbi:MAG: cadherin-like beta sandwich domain-containing protein, partial [Bacilli bacterium]|nr:cadherin-like beta sandwich domain-containing protein [Bacilli bacterium]
CYVNIVEATRPNSGGSSYYSYNSDNNEVDPDLSSNSYLKTLSIDGVKINPEFDKDKMEYTAIVSGDTEKINITGELEDDKALVEGLGEKELKEGINTFEIKVTAENTEVRTYVLTVTRKEINPIEITINKKKYIVSKKEIGLEVPKGFTKTKTVIEKQEVVAYSNSFTGYLLVALVDEDGNASWFIYNQKNETYTKYSEYNSDSIRLVLITPKKKDIPYKYKKCDFFINGELVEGYALQLTSPFRLVYALNMATGEENFYLYDMDQNTFQRFYNTQTEIYRDLLKKLEIGIIGLVGLLFIMFIIIISQKVINTKTRKFIKNGGVVEEKKDIQPDEDFEPSDKPKKVKKQKEEKKEIPEEKEEIKDEKVKEKLTKAELKKKRKEEKKKLAEERKEFFD